MAYFSGHVAACIGGMEHSHIKPLHKIFPKGYGHDIVLTRVV